MRPAGTQEVRCLASEGTSLTESARRRLRPASVLPPPQDYQRYRQYQRQQSGPPDRWQPPGANTGYSPSGWPPEAQLAHGGWAPTHPPRRSSLVAQVLLGMVGTGAVLFFALIVLGTVATPSAPVRGDIASHEPAPAADPNAAPVSAQEPVTVLKGNTLYDQGGLPNGNCPAQDLGDASTAAQTRFYESLMSCLNAEWRPPIESAGYTYAEPGLVVFDSPVSTPCGNAAPEAGRTLAFYCPSDSVMYADVPQMSRFFGSVDVAYAIVIGHEFGHHVQAETGILSAFDDVTYRNFADRTAVSRRLELQASCMGGLFLGAVADSFPIDESRFVQLQQVAGAFGDEPNASPDGRDHGSGESNRSWILRGFNDNDVAACDTFVASAGDVD